MNELNVRIECCRRADEGSIEIQAKYVCSTFPDSKDLGVTEYVREMGVFHVANSAEVF